MASPSRSDDHMKCEETGCHGHSILTHYIDQVTRRICHACALEKGHFHLLGHKKWHCERHQELVKAFCITHGEGCCKSCQLIFHQSPCQVSDINTVVDEKQKLLEAKMPLKKKSTKILTDCLQRVSESVLASGKSFQELVDEVVQHFDEVLGKEVEREKEAMYTINKKYDDKMTKLLEKRECDLKRCREAAEQQRKPLQESKKNILDEIRRCERSSQAEIEKLQHEMEELQIIIHDQKININHVLHAEQEIVLKSDEVCVEIESTFKRVVKVNEVLEETNGITNFISLLRKRRNGREHLRLYSTPHGPWKLVDEFRISSHMNDLRILGCAFNENAFFEDVKTGVGYIFDSIKREMVQVLQYDGRGSVNCCTPLDEDLLLCGRTHGGCSKRTLSECICLYDRQWQLRKSIPIPRHTSGPFSCVSVDVDCNGMIVASEANQSHIYVINPANGLIVKTILLQDAKCKRCLCMPSGYIVVSTGQGEFTILDQTGKSKRILRDDDWLSAVDFSLDPLLDTMYVVYRDESHDSYAVDEVSVGGKISKKILNFPQANWSDTTAKSRTYPIVITPAGKLIACNEDNVFIFKRTVYFNDTVLI